MDMSFPLLTLLVVYLFLSASLPRLSAWLKRRRERREWKELDDAVVNKMARCMADQDRDAYELAEELAAEIELAVDRREVGEGRLTVRWEGSSIRHELDGPDAR